MTRVLQMSVFQLARRFSRGASFDQSSNKSYGLFWCCVLEGGSLLAEGKTVHQRDARDQLRGQPRQSDISDLRLVLRGAEARRL